MAGKWMPAAQLTSSGRPVLNPGEVESTLLSSVDLECEDNSQFPQLKSGLLILTNHRIFWIHETNTSSNAASAVAIPLGTVTHIFPPKKKMFSTPRIRFQVSTSADGKIDENGLQSLVITLVLRGSKSEPELFYSRFCEVLKVRAWEVMDVQSSESLLNPASSVIRTTPVVGISGILRREQELWENTDKSLQDAFQDLNALMSKAKEMVMLAEKMRLKLLSVPTNEPKTSNDEDTTSKQEMQDWLLSVGIASPVTKESAGALYHQQLSRQLADFVKLPLERAGGMIALIDVYCLFNRARGTELISPEDLLRACAIWEKFEVPVMLRKFDSGVMVIQNKSHSDEEVLLRIKSLVSKPEALRTGVSPSDAAMTLGIAPAMAKEHLLTAESKGVLCRDISPEGFRFFINLFQEIDSKEIYSVKDYGLYKHWVAAT